MMFSRFIVRELTHKSCLWQHRNIHQFSCFSSAVQLTHKRYNIKRGHFKEIDENDIGFFHSLLEPHQILTQVSELECFNTDWFRSFRGSSQILLKPKSTKEVSEILKYCNDNLIAVCPQGGNTGVVGGAVPVFDEVILSSCLLNKVINVDTLSGVVTCESGCILEDLDHHIATHNLMVPLDLGAKGSCHIGGNISTNAGGLRVLRYGSLHSTVLGVEAVLASGEIIDCLTTMKKDNTGYGLKHLFIGSEGTLGFVTKISIQCVTRPESVILIFVGLTTFSCVLRLFKNSKMMLGEILSSFEFIDQSSLNCVEKYLHLRSPVGTHPFYAMVETSGSDNAHDQAKVNSFINTCLSDFSESTATVMVEPSKVQSAWKIRERLPEALMYDGYAYWYDVSLPLHDLYDVVEAVTNHLRDDVVRVSGFGHIGDGNLHLNITSKQYSKDIAEKIESFLYKLTSELRGSISAEHGLGVGKRNFIHYSKSSNAVKLMRCIKKCLDPNGILNPYKVLPGNTEW